MMLPAHSPPSVGQSNRNNVESASNASQMPSQQTERHATQLRAAARDFESLLLRQMLSSLEKTTKVGSAGNGVAGQHTYGSMVVEAVADAVAQAGGLGLAQLLSDALITKNAISPHTTAPTASIAGPGGDSTRGPHPSTATANTVASYNSSQGSAIHAVPTTEIRTTNSQPAGQLTDRRIR